MARAGLVQTREQPVYDSELVAGPQSEIRAASPSLQQAVGVSVGFEGPNHARPGGDDAAPGTASACDGSRCGGSDLIAFGQRESCVEGRAAGGRDTGGVGDMVDAHAPPVEFEQQVERQWLSSGRQLECPG